jgi:hypothetical protein
VFKVIKVKRFSDDGFEGVTKRRHEFGVLPISILRGSGHTSAATGWESGEQDAMSTRRLTPHPPSCTARGKAGCLEGPAEIFEFELQFATCLPGAGEKESKSIRR